MKAQYEALAGALLFTGAAQFLLCLIAAEALYPGYSVHSNAISDLGIGQTALIFNASAIAFGLLALAGAWLVFKALKARVFPALLALAGLGIIGVGLFPETFFPPHFASALLAFFCSGLAAITSYRIQSKPMNYTSVVLGAITLAALALTVSHNYMGLGSGGMERMIVYPVLIWAMGFGGSLAAKGEK